MANFVYNEAKRLAAESGINWASATVKVRLVRTGSTAGSERNANTLAEFSTMNTYNGSGYADQTVGGRSVFENAVANRVELVAGNVTFAGLGGLSAPNEAIGAVFYIETGASDAQRIPLAWWDSGFPFNGTGSDVTLRPNAAGLVQLG